ncbi:PucR family transcriptional regulator [Gordonia lacunae]|uniref:PucR family transcriptional regulator n=1 Tax=Gordonia lacunae TaxID=417102 RepID=UPI0039E69FBF
MQTSSKPREQIRRLARELLPYTQHFADQITEHVLHAVPGIALEATSKEVRLVQESNEQNCGTFLAALAFGVPPTAGEPPEATRLLVRETMTAGGSPRHILRGYQVGQEKLWQLWSEYVHTRVDSESLFEVLRLTSSHLFQFVDHMSQVLITEYEQAIGPDSMRPSTYASSLKDNREELVPALLSTEAVDSRLVEEQLSYSLADVHVALWAAPLKEAAPTRGELQRVVERSHARALVVAGPENTWWAWLAWPSAPSAEQLRELSTTSVTGVAIGMGEPQSGRHGFRTSHMQAHDAYATATLRAQPEAGISWYRDVEVASLLCIDPDRARQMATERLGPLAGDGEMQQRLRETLRTTLRHGNNRAKAAKELNVHHKTVTYRITQAEELLGRDLSRDTLDIEVAILIAETLG